MRLLQRLPQARSRSILLALRTLDDSRLSSVARLVEYRVQQRSIRSGYRYQLQIVCYIQVETLRGVTLLSTVRGRTSKLLRLGTPLLLTNRERKPKVVCSKDVDSSSRATLEIDLKGVRAGEAGLIEVVSLPQTITSICDLLATIVRYTIYSKSIYTS